MKVYIAGPMSGMGPDYNYPAFHAAAATLRAEGYHVVNPAEQFGGNQSLPWRTYLRHAVRQVAKCDAIAVLPGWETSNGARLEAAVAIALCLRFMYLDGAARRLVRIDATEQDVED
jgi:hypothetical protein